MRTEKTTKNSYFILTYNNLDGKIITRKKLEKFTQELQQEKQIKQDTYIKIMYTNLAKVLQENPEHHNFKINLKNKFSINTIELQEISGLGLPYLDTKTQKELGEDESTGLNKPISNDDIYQMITDKIIKAIDDYGDLTWYSGRDNEKGKDRFIKLPLPINYNSDKYYRGINSFILTLYPKFKGLVKRGKRQVKKYSLIPIDDERLFWLTFKQIKDNKGKLKKNATSMQVVYYNFIYKNGKETISEKEFNKLYRKCKTSKKPKSKECYDLKRIPFLKYFNVFNERDITGIDFEKKRKELDKKETKFEAEIEKIEAAENIIKAMPKRPKIIERHIGSGESPNYRPSNDTVTMPLKEQYKEVAIWYGTAFHELVHSTGAAKRVGRVGVTEFDRFGSTQYAFEELIAELGSAFLNGQSGILLKTLKKNSTYINGWKKKVLGMLKENNKAIFRASAEAQKAANYILDYNKKGVPKYLQKVIARRKKPQKKSKAIINENGQYALLGAAKKNKKKILPFSEQEKIKKSPVEYYKIKGAIKQLLGNVEIKPKESVVITVSAPEGAGKTTLALQFAHEFASNRYDVLCLSLEEHKESDLFKRKVRKYISKSAQNNFFPISELDNNYNALIKLILDYDVIIIDSFKKLKKIFKRIDLDEDLRKKVDGKLFIVLYQLTQKGEMRGGSDAQFDGDIILKVEKSQDFKENYCVATKNRYQNKDIHTLKYNIFYKRMI